MKTLQTLLLALFFITCFVLSTKAESLKETSKNFTELLAQTELSDVEFAAKIKPFIDPEANVDSLCNEYYQHWQHCVDDNFYPLKTSIAQIDKTSKKSATVLVSNVWHCTGDQFYVESKTEWIKRNNKWYRSVKESSIVANERLEIAYTE